MGKRVGVINKVKFVAQPKFFIPGRDRGSDGVLLGTGGSSWEQIGNSISNKAEDGWNQINGLINGGGNNGGGGEFTNTKTGANSASEVATLSGRVMGTDEEGSYLGFVPKAHVQITSDDGLTPLNVYADQTGYYTVSGLKPGQYTCYVKGDGYSADSSGKGFVIPANPSPGYVVNFTLTQSDFSADIEAGTISGHAWDDREGNLIPLAGAKVVVRLESGGYGYREGITDKNGAYSFNVAPGMWKASATPRGVDSMGNQVYPDIVTVKKSEATTANFIFRMDDERVPPTAGEVRVLISVPLVTEGAFPDARFVHEATGKVYPAKVNPAPETNPPRADTVRWYQGEPSEPLPEGRYHAVVDHNDGKLKSTGKTAAAGQSTWFDVAFRSIDQPTRDKEPVLPKDPKTPTEPDVPEVKPELDIFTSYGGSGIYNVSVTLTKKNPGEEGGRPFTWVTNDEGRVSGAIEDGPGTYSVLASAEGCRDLTSEVVVKQTNPTLSIEMIPIPRLSFTVRDSNGSPLPKVDAWLVDKTRGKSLSEAITKTSGNSGSEVFYLNEGLGTYVLMAKLDGYLPFAEELKLVEDPTKVEKFLFEKDIVLYKSGEIRSVNLTGTLVELTPGQDKAYKDGKKIPNAQIAFRASEGMTLPDILSTPLRTGSQGEIAAEKVPEGTYIVSIAAEGYESYSGPVTVGFGMEPLLLSLKPRNTARDNWIKMILTEGWGDIIKSRQFHQSGTQGDATDSNVDFALALSSLEADDKDNAVPSFSLAVGKVSEEKWWDRATEGHIWALMNYEDVGTAVSEIRRLVTSEYSSRAETDESREAAYMFGVAVGVMKGPWMVESAGELYNQLDADVTAALKGTHLTSYEAGKKSVLDKYSQLSAAEEKAKKEMMEAAAADRDRKLKDLKEQLEELEAEMETNTQLQNVENEKFTNYSKDVQSQVNGHNAILAQLLNESTALQAELTQLQNNQNAGMQTQADQKLREIEDGLGANLASQNAEVTNFNTYYNNLEPQMAGYVNRINAINAQLETLGKQMANTPATLQGEMSGPNMSDLEAVEIQIGDLMAQAEELNQGINNMQQTTAAQIQNLGANLQQSITNRQNAIQQRVNELNQYPAICSQCREFSEQVPNCEDCAAVRAQIQAELARLEKAFYEETPEETNMRSQITALENDYNNALANYNANIQNLNAQDGRLRAEYERIAAQLNNPPPQKANPAMTTLQNQDAKLRADYEDQYKKWENADASFKKEQSQHQARLQQLKQDEANLRNQLANFEAPMPAVDPTIAQKTERYNQILIDDKAERAKLAKVQEDYRIEGERYQKEIARLTGLSENLKNQIDTLNAQMGGGAGLGETAGIDGDAVDSSKLTFITYKDYPLGQRRDELLSWVTRSADVALPAAAK